MKAGEIETLIGYRLEQARTALEDAEFLAQGQRSPQSIVNRAYYATFYAVLALLQKKGRIPSKHTGAIGLFDTEFVRTGLLPRDLSKHLHRAFELRQSSDYRVVERISAERALDTLRNARRFVDAVEHLLSSGESAGTNTEPS
jgi:uncharacterized protein (UPF0332 family)